MKAPWFSLGFAALGLTPGCSGRADQDITLRAPSEAGPSPDTDAAPPTGDDASAPPPNQDDGSAPTADGGDAAPAGDDAATRNSTCVPESQQTGTIVNTSHGRLDGTLVYVLPVGGSGKCNGDDSHVHLQIEVSGLVYDVAVDVGSTGDQVGMYQETIALPDDAWSAGWHGSDNLSYSTLALSSANFPIQSPAVIATQVETMLENTTKISVFCTGYAQGDGCHDVHWENGTSTDGAIVVDPTSPTSPVLFFRFQAQSF